MDTLKTLIGYKKFTSNQSYSRKSVHLIFTTAILYFWRMWTSRDNESGTIEKLDPKNMGIAVGILLLCALKLEICLVVKLPPPPYTCQQTSQKNVAGTRVKSVSFDLQMYLNCSYDWAKTWQMDIAFTKSTVMPYSYSMVIERLYL